MGYDSASASISVYGQSVHESRSLIIIIIIIIILVIVIIIIIIIITTITIIIVKGSDYYTEDGSWATNSWKISE